MKNDLCMIYKSTILCEILSISESVIANFDIKDIRRSGIILKWTFISYTHPVWSKSVWIIWRHTLIHHFRIIEETLKLKEKSNNYHVAQECSNVMSGKCFILETAFSFPTFLLFTVFNYVSRSLSEVTL